MDTRIENFTFKYNTRMWSKEKHRRDSTHRIQRFVGVVGNIELAEIDGSHLYRMMDALEADGLSKATSNRYVAAVQAVLSFARASGMAARVISVKTLSEDHRIRFFSDHELDAIRLFCVNRNVPAWFRHMCVLARYTGMRHSEISNLRDPSKARVEEGADGLWWITLFETKNGDQRQIALYKDEAVEAARSLAAGFRYNAKEFYLLWNVLRARVAPGDKDFVFHVFRHTAASAMANDMRLNSDVIGQWLGHRNNKTTSKYIHIKPDTIVDIAKRMAAAG